MSDSWVQTDFVMEAENLSKRFGRKLALNDLTMRVRRGGVHAVIGSNGAGKSTLFRVLLGLVSPSWGSSRILGVDSQDLRPEVRGRIGLVHEEHTLPGWMSVQGITDMQRSQYPSWSEVTYQEVLGHFNVLPEQKVVQLSRGERAGLNLALALAQGPELLILDEPTLGLDVVAKQAFLESLLFTGERTDCTIIYCSHQMDEIERVADNLIILERGKLANMSAPEDFRSRISYWLTEFPQGPPDLDAFPGLLQYREIEGQRHLVVLDQDPGYGRTLQQLGASMAQAMPIGLDRAVNAYLTRHHNAPATS